MTFDFYFVEQKYQRSHTILSLGIKCSMCDLFCGVSYCALARYRPNISL